MNLVKADGVGYSVTGVRGIPADIQAAHDETDKQRITVQVLTRWLGLDTNVMVGVALAYCLKPGCRIPWRQSPRVGARA
jgi:hypothetical protein